MRTCFEGWLIPARHAVHEGVATASSDRVHACGVTLFSEVSATSYSITYLS